MSWLDERNGVTIGLTRYERMMYLWDKKWRKVSRLFATEYLDRVFLGFILEKDYGCVCSIRI